MKQVLNSISTSISKSRNGFSPQQEYAVFYEEIEDNIKRIEQTDINEKQKLAIERARDRIERAKNATGLVEFWAYINLARAQEPFYLPEQELVEFARILQVKDKDFLPVSERQAWQKLINRLVSELEALNKDSKSVPETYRISLNDCLNKFGRRWNSLNAKEQAKLRLWLRISALLLVFLPIGLLLLSLYNGTITHDLLTAVIFGGIGGLISSSTSIPSWPFRFRSRAIDFLAFLVRPLTGSVVAVILLQFLTSGISPIQLQAYAVTSKSAWIASISFAAGFAERIVITKLNIMDVKK